MKYALGRRKIVTTGCVFSSLPSNHLHALPDIVGVLRHIELKDLKHIDLLWAGCKTSIPENSTQRLPLGDLLDHALRNILIKAGAL